MKAWNKFKKEEDGAVTVDFVVLTAALVGLAAGVVIPIAMSSSDHAESVGSYIASQDIATY